MLAEGRCLLSEPRKGGSQGGGEAKARNLSRPSLWGGETAMGTSACSPGDRGCHTHLDGSGGWRRPYLQSGCNSTQPTAPAYWSKCPYWSKGADLSHSDPWGLTEAVQ